MSIGCLLISALSKNSNGNALDNQSSRKHFWYWNRLQYSDSFEAQFNFNCFSIGSFQLLEELAECYSLNYSSVIFETQRAFPIRYATNRTDLVIHRLIKLSHKLSLKVLNKIFTIQQGKFHPQLSPLCKHKVRKVELWVPTIPFLQHWDDSRPKFPEISEILLCGS